MLGGGGSATASAAARERALGYDERTLSPLGPVGSVTINKLGRVAAALSEVFITPIRV